MKRQADMLTDSRKRIFLSVAQREANPEPVSLSLSLSLSDPISVLQSALTLQIEPLWTELQEKHRSFTTSTLQTNLR